MTEPKTKTVLGRVFTWSTVDDEWQCETKRWVLTLCGSDSDELPWRAALESAPWKYLRDSPIAYALGPTESDAILELQSTLRKMALLEVAE